jgi:hypothetical protein
MEAAIGDKQVTYDFARLMEGANEVSCSEFGDAMIARMYGGAGPSLPHRTTRAPARGPCVFRVLRPAHRQSVR